MSIRLFTLPGYSHLYRSLLRFCDMGSREAREFVYILNTANLDSYRFAYPYTRMSESGYVAFTNGLERLRRRPYRTEVQLHKALAALHRNLIPKALTDEQRAAAAKLRYLMRSIELSFYKAFGMEIDDPLTEYSACEDALVPDDFNEPPVCLRQDCDLLPIA